MGAKNSTLSFDTGIQMQKKRRTSYKKSHSRKKLHSHKKRHTKKNHFPNMPFPKQPPFPNMPFPKQPSFPKPPPFPNMPFPTMPGHKKSSKSRHHHTHKKSKKNMILPGGNWINTAKDFYIINNILYAKLRTKSGNYIHAQTVFSPNQRFQNKDGRFSLLLY